MNNLRLTTVQCDITWHDRTANCTHLHRLCRSIKGTDIVVLPEMFSTGFTMQPKLVAETMQGDTLRWMAAVSADLDALLIGSIVITERDQHYNRLICMRPDGQFSYYDKRHLFALAGEDSQYTAGRDLLIVDWKGWKICPLICYDLRFPVWAHHKSTEYDLLIYVANWPSMRIGHWDQLLAARAIENQCYTVGVNRVGEDPNAYVYNGHSAVFSYNGALIYRHEEGTAGLRTAILNKEKQQRYRSKLPFLQDADRFTFQN